jgi:hypothetical protein
MYSLAVVGRLNVSVPESVLPMNNPESMFSIPGKKGIV